MVGPRSVAAFSPSMNTGAAGSRRCRERNPDVGMLGFAGAVDDAAHHRHLQRLDAG